MNIILDTHAFLWYARDAPELSANAVSAIDSSVNAKFVSIGSIWEIAIKISLDKLHIDLPFEELRQRLVDGNGFTILPKEYDHSVAVSTLPFHHRDPFDRMLIAQSIVESMPIVRADRAFDAYGIQRLW